MQKHILVTGGAGYIGSHTVYQLIDHGYQVTILDNLSTGYRELLHAKARFIEGDMGDARLLEKLFSETQFDGIIHFAAFIQVEESTRKPLKYYQNNTAKALTLIQAATNAKIPNFIFSSTAAVYGEPQKNPITEDFPLQPINPYGASKLLTERILQDACAASNMKFAILRYFNVAGAREGGQIGQRTEKATHLIKIASEAACGKRKSMSIFGSDYPTADGTCIRDYIHVDDLALAHIKALEYLSQGGKSEIFNLGYGHGASVSQVIDTMKKVSAVNFEVSLGPRRAGDPSQLIADSSKARSVLKWKPQHDNLDYICRTAYEWEKGLGQELTHD